MNDRLEVEWLARPRLGFLSVHRLGTWTHGRLEPGSLCGLALCLPWGTLCVWWWPVT